MLKSRPAYLLDSTPKLLIADGAGTLFDPGSVVPVYGFQKGFKEYVPKDSNKKFQFEPDFDLVMKFMGRDKLEHIKLLLKEPSVLYAFYNQFSRNPIEEDAKGIYENFKIQLYPAATRTEEIPGVKESVFRLKDSGVPIVMTTGYDRKMVDETRKKLPWLDNLLLDSFTSSDVSKGRPAPYLIFHAMESAGVENPSYALNVGDTLVDTQSADNAHMAGIIVLSGSVNEQEAEKINQFLGRKHLILPSLTEVIDYILDGTIVDRINRLND